MKKITLTLMTIFVLLSFNSIAQATLTMYLNPSSQTVNVGDTFNLEVGLNNPDSVAFDALSFWIAFDPTKLSVQDTDADNWIASGTNVLDGPYHIAYPFNVHFQNSANNTTGQIFYEEGIFPDTISSSGPFARVTFLTMNLTPSTPINFNFNWGEINDTRVTNGGVDILGSSSNHTDGTFGASITVIPEPTTLLLMGFGFVAGVLRRFRHK